MRVGSVVTAVVGMVLLGALVLLMVAAFVCGVRRDPVAFTLGMCVPLLVLVSLVVLRDVIEDVRGG